VEKCEILDNLQKVSENVKKYNCVNCNYIGCRQSQYDRHCFTAKHIKMTDRCKIGSEHTCSCGKTFKYRQGLHKHKNKCSPDFNKDVVTENPVIDTNLIMKLIQHNENLQNLLVRQASEHSQKQTELMNKFMEREPVHRSKIGYI